MISVKTKNTVESKAIPGVTFTVRTLNKIQRAKRDLPISEARCSINVLIDEYTGLKKIPEADRTPEQVRRMEVIDCEEYPLIYATQLMPAHIRAGLVSIAGIEIDGKPADADSLIESAGADYDDLLSEIDQACVAASGLTPAEIKNSGSPSTSTGQEATETKTSDAGPAEN